MLDEKKIKEVQQRVQQYLKEGIIRTKSKPENVDFFIKSAEDSIDSAKALFDLSTDVEKQKYMGFARFNGLLWVVNASYYGMFYLARALLELEGVIIKTDFSIHAVTFDTLIYFLYLNGKLQKEFVDDFVEAQEEAAELLGKQKADGLLEDYFFEKRKRATFTYNVGELLIRSKAKTSLERAQKFRLEIKKIIIKKKEQKSAEKTAS